MSDDPQAQPRWWLASDGKWYPPELHPDFRPGAHGEDRNAALLTAAIGVERVRESLFASVRTGHPAPGAPSGPEDPLPRFRSLPPPPHDEGGPDRAPARWPTATVPPGRDEAPPEPQQAVFEEVPRFRPEPRPDAAEAEEAPAGLAAPTGPAVQDTPTNAAAAKEPEPFASAPADQRALPLHGRRRPPRVRSNTALRDAVAEAVARAAAQGPLVPRAQDENAQADPYEELARLAAEQAMAGDEGTETGEPATPEGTGVTGQLVETAGAAPEAGQGASDDAVIAEAIAAYLSPTLSVELRVSEDWQVEVEPQEPTEPPPPVLDEGDGSPTEEVAPTTGQAAGEQSGAAGTEEPAVQPGPGEGPELAESEPVVEHARDEQEVTPEKAAVETGVDDTTAEEQEAGLPVETGGSEEPAPEAGATTGTAAEEAGADSGETATTGTAAEEAGADSAETAPPEEEEPPDAGKTADEALPWPYGERRSAARQARKPLPAALQEAVAAGAAQDLGQGRPFTGRPSDTGPGPGGGGGAGHAGAGGSELTEARPGILRRYGSAIVVAVLFVIAAGVTAGIAAFRGPVASVSPDQAAAARAVLGAAEFPASWKVSDPGNDPSSYGLGSALVTPATLQRWVRANRSCATAVVSLGASMAPNVRDLSAVAYSKAESDGPHGAVLKIADSVAFHQAAPHLRASEQSMRTLLVQPYTQACLERFVFDALSAGLPSGSFLSVSVAVSALPPLPGAPYGWVFAFTGNEVVRGNSTPVSFRFTSFCTGRVQVGLSSSALGGTQPASLDSALLSTLASRAQRLAASPSV